MKEFKVGQKVWSIQLGDCVVESDSLEYYPILCKNKEGMTETYMLNGKSQGLNFYPSLFESNPFERSVDTNETIEPQIVRQQNDGLVENKAELINALKSVVACEIIRSKVRIIAEDNLQKLLESL